VALSARAFYFVMFGLYYLAAILYPNKLKLAFQDSFFTFYGWSFLLIHGVAIYLFLTAGRNPGYVDETETPQSRKEKARMFIGQYDEFRTVEGSDAAGKVDNRNYVEVDMEGGNETNVSTT